MIRAVLVFNHRGKARLIKFYEHYAEDEQQNIIKETFQLVSNRDDRICNFLHAGKLVGGSDFKLIYRHYATLYFVFCADSAESELGILDLIQIFVEALDKCFDTVCELDLIFNCDKAHNILNEIVMGGLVLETNLQEILDRIDEQNKLEKQLAGFSGASNHAASVVRTKVNLSGHLREIKNELKRAYNK